MHLFEDRGPVVKVYLIEIGKPGDGLIDAGIPGRDESHPGPFCIHVFPSPSAPGTATVPAVRYPPA